MTWPHLEEAIRHAEAIYLAKAEDLQHIFSNDKITEDSIREWLAGVTHNPEGRHKTLRTYATAHYKKQQIIYNPIYLVVTNLEDEYTFVLDTVLHELGHLFTHHFLHRGGHGWEWRTVGTVVGYAPVGSTSDTRRKRYRAYARCANEVEPLGVMTGSIGRVTTQRRRHPDSLVASPVARVHEICDEYAPWGYSRKQIMEVCLEEGINKNTASTQIYHWKKAHPEYSL